MCPSIWKILNSIKIHCNISSMHSKTSWVHLLKHCWWKKNKMDSLNWTFFNMWVICCNGAYGGACGGDGTEARAWEHVGVGARCMHPIWGISARACDAQPTAWFCSGGSNRGCRSSAVLHVQYCSLTCGLHRLSGPHVSEQYCRGSQLSNRPVLCFIYCGATENIERNDIVLPSPD